MKKLAVLLAGWGAVWDWFTNVTGVMALFGQPTPNVVAFAFVASLGLSGYLLATFALVKAEVPTLFKALLIGIWIVMFGFNAYTTFLGHAQLALGLPFATPAIQILARIRELGVAQWALISATTLAVISFTMCISLLVSPDVSGDDGSMLGKVSGGLVVCIITFLGLGGLVSWALPEVPSEGVRIEENGMIVDHGGIQLVVKERTPGGNARCECTLGPRVATEAIIHDLSDKEVEVHEGTLTVHWPDNPSSSDRKVAFQLGERLRIEKGRAHSFGNETDSRVVFWVNMPERLVIYLYQVNLLAKAQPARMKGLRANVRKLVMSPALDCWETGPDLEWRRVLSYLLSPTARLVGVRAYPESMPRIEDP